MPKLQITDPNLLAFCKSLAAMVKEHSALNLDLSDPVHCGMIRMLDVALARTGEKFPVDRDFPLYDAAPGNNPFDVTESYAMMPKDESGVYITPAPDGDENDIAWLADNQRGFSVSGNTVTTELSEQQLGQLFQAAQSGRLYALIPGHAIDEFGSKGAFQIRSDESGTVSLYDGAELTSSDITSMDRASRAMFEFRSAMNQKAMGLANDLDPEEQNEFRAKGLHVNAFWSAKYHGTPVMKKEAVLSAVCLVGDSSDGIVVSSLEDLMNFAVADNGRTRPLVDADTFLAYAEKDPAVAKTYLQSKLVEAFDRKTPVFYRSRLTGETVTCSLERGDEGDLTVHGKDINKSIRGVERPSFYLFKRIVNYFSKGTYPEVTKYQKRLRAESAKEYFEKTADTRREKYAAYNEKVRQTKEAGKATLKEYAAAHETVKLTPSNGFTHEHLICPSSRLNEIVTSYEEKFGPLSDDFKSSLHDLHESAVNDEEILRANSICEKPFSAEAEVKSVLTCRTVVGVMERGQLSPSLIGLVTENKMDEVLAGDGNLSYFTDHAHAGSFYLENLLDAAKLDAAGEKVVQGAERVAAKEAMLEAAKAQKLNAPERQAAEKAVSKPDLAPQMP